MSLSVLSASGMIEMIFAPSGNISLFLNSSLFNKTQCFFLSFGFFQMKWDVGEHFHLLFSPHDRRKQICLLVWGWSWA